MLTAAPVAILSGRKLLGVLIPYFYKCHRPVGRQPQVT